MIVTRTSFPRRTFLRGMGATLALPLLDAMAPAMTLLAQTGATHSAAPGRSAAAPAAAREARYRYLRRRETERLLHLLREDADIFSFRRVAAVIDRQREFNRAVEIHLQTQLLFDRRRDLLAGLALETDIAIVSAAIDDVRQEYAELAEEYRRLEREARAGRGGGLVGLISSLAVNVVATAAAGVVLGAAITNGFGRAIDGGSFGEVLFAMGLAAGAAFAAGKVQSEIASAGAGAPPGAASPGASSVGQLKAVSPAPTGGGLLGGLPPLDRVALVAADAVHFAAGQGLALMDSRVATISPFGPSRLLPPRSGVEPFPAPFAGSGSAAVNAPAASGTARAGRLRRAPGSDTFLVDCAGPGAWPWERPPRVEAPPGRRPIDPCGQWDGAYLLGIHDRQREKAYHDRIQRGIEDEADRLQRWLENRALETRSIVRAGELVEWRRRYDDLAERYTQLRKALENQGGGFLGAFGSFVAGAVGTLVGGPFLGIAISSAFSTALNGGGVDDMLFTAGVSAGASAAAAKAGRMLRRAIHPVSEAERLVIDPETASAHAAIDEEIIRELNDLQIAELEALADSMGWEQFGREFGDEYIKAYVQRSKSRPVELQASIINDGLTLDIGQKMYDQQLKQWKEEYDEALNQLHHPPAHTAGKNCELCTTNNIIGPPPTLKAHQEALLQRLGIRRGHSLFTHDTYQILSYLNGNDIRLVTAISDVRTFVENVYAIQEELRHRQLAVQRALRDVYLQANLRQTRRNRRR